ncbi:hypothetical protein PR048_015257 [Dryococelus australis]|uniref:Cyclic nucleotide-binding domain-containing protein n=1 Tax=Dryococelus australis TaxID=614101 RepID=A0ABQ9HGK8_9NEOP|nr:hypothetical protein PR048_015257 [Dryococelus australis]
MSRPCNGSKTANPLLTESADQMLSDVIRELRSCTVVLKPQPTLNIKNKVFEELGRIVLQELQAPVIRFSTRRKSVFAESYNPEEDDDDEGIKEQTQNVLDAMFEKKVSSGDYIIRQGDDGDNFYVIERFTKLCYKSCGLVASGVYNVYVTSDQAEEPRHIHTYDNVGSFGELALMYNMPRAATIKAVSDGSLWAMDRMTFRRIVLKSAFKKRKMYEQLIDSVPMLKALQPYERMSLADALLPRVYSDVELIIKQGDIADGMYLVEEGVVQITVLNDDGREVEVSRIEKGGYFGELALVTHKPRAASAYAVGTVKLACE